MKGIEKRKQTILIADDSEINRSLLADMLGNEFEILEAEDGQQAVAALQREGGKIDLVLLDIVMPNMDGFEVLASMIHNGWMKDIPVIMISSETSPSCIERAYELGVTDFINRPFDVWIVRKRVMNTLVLTSKQKKLVSLVTDQIFEREKMSNMMITILSHIVEFRNGESGMHVLHIRTLVDLLLRDLVLKTDRYNLTQTDISLISTASALHDIGKIGIPDEILNKPGKLTAEEYEVMKRHSEIGAGMLDDLDFLQDEKLVTYARQICRWHHERYDGKGYPDGLKGEEIPIAAQIVSLADVYDALTSERVYKPAFSHEEAMHMITNGQCGTFNPLLLECLHDVQGKIKEELSISSFSRDTYEQIPRVTDEILQHDELSTSARTLTLLENERIKTRFFAELSHEIQFEYVYDPSMLMVSDFGERKLGLGEIVMNPLEDKNVLALFGREYLDEFVATVQKTTPEDYAFSMELLIPLGGEERWVRVSGRALFSGEQAVRTGVIGKIIDINSERKAMNELEHKATHDLLTLLYNGGTAREKIVECLKREIDREYVMLIIDLDYFKTINDTYGHSFGNDVLKHVSEKLRNALRKEDIIARIGGDEFLVLFEGHQTQGITVKRIFESLTEPFKNLQMSVSVGVALTTECGRDYDKLFKCADKALYEAKREGRHCVRYYDKSYTEGSSNTTEIEEGNGDAGEPLTLTTKDDLIALLRDLRRVYDCVRVFDIAQSVRLSVGEDGSLSEAGNEDNYTGAGRTGVYERALMTKGKASEVAFRGNDLLYVTAVFAQCREKSYVIEVISVMENDGLGGVYNKTEIIARIDARGAKKYQGDVENTYNRRFYDEQLSALTNFYACAAIKAEHAEKEEMRRIAEIVARRVRVSDIVVRKEDDEYLVILKNVGDEHFKKVTENLYAELKQAGFGVSVGACRALGTICALADVAESNAKKAKGGILIDSSALIKKGGN